MDIEARQTLETVFNKEGFQYEIVKSVSQGHKKVTKEHYDLIVSEHSQVLKDLDSLDLLQKVRESSATLPFVIISDEENSAECSVKAIKYGVSGYLTKPLEQKETHETIKRAIRHYKGRFLKNELENYKMESTYSAVIKSNEQAIMKLIETVDNLIELVYPKEYGSLPDLKMAMYESLGNAVEHGNAGENEKNIYFRIELKMDRIMVHIKDEGSGFDSFGAMRGGGAIDPKSINRGLRLINHLMDEVTFNIKGNEINLLKILQ